MTVHYHLVRDASVTREAAGILQLAYVPEITVRLDPGYLVGYLRLMAMLGVFLHAVSGRPEQAQCRFEEQLLEQAIPLDRTGGRRHESERGGRALSSARSAAEAASHASRVASTMPAAGKMSPLAKYLRISHLAYEHRCAFPDQPRGPLLPASRLLH